MATGLGSDKLEALRQFLATLPPQMQGRLGEALAHVRETDPSFPAELILEAVNQADAPTALPDDPGAEIELAPPPLDPERRYTLRELVCLGLEPFLVDEAPAVLVPGTVPKSALDPWWEAMLRMGCEAIDGLEQELATRYEEKGDVAAFGVEARRKVSAWSDSFVEKLNQGKTLVPELRTLFKEKLIREHVTEITQMMRVCEPVIAALYLIAPRGRLAEFAEETAARAKPVFLAAAARMDGDARLLVLGLFNKLDRPWQIIRLATALGWSRAAGATARNTEMTAICERLIPVLVDAANTTKAATAQRTTLTSGATDFAELRQHVIRYAQVAEALAAEVDFRKDSAWGAQIIKSREAMRGAFDAERLDVIENVIVGFMPSVLEAEAPPAEPAISHAVGAARLLMAVAGHGQRHGFGSDASVLIGKLGKELERLTEMLLAKPHGHEPQLDGAVKVISILFQDVRAQTLARRVDVALGRPPG